MSHSAQPALADRLQGVAWLLRQPEDAIIVQELVDLYCSARRTPAGS